MKLRNKKTGELVDAWSFYDGNESVNIKYFTDDGQVNLEYNSLSELNDEWEDYEPVGPLIKDEKARNVFREWAELLGAKLFRVEHLCKYSRTIITSTDLIPKPAIVLPGYIGKDSETYTKEELCGDEEK